MQQLDAVLQYCRQAGQDQMAKCFKRCYICEVVIFFFPFFKYSDTPYAAPIGGADGNPTGG